MPKLAIACGLLLVLVGSIGSFVAMTMVAEWWYASIPALIGILLILCGWVAARGKVARVVGLITALLVAASGVIGSFMPSGLDFSAPGSVGFVSSIFRLLTIAIGASFLLLCVRSLGAARRR